MLSLDESLLIGIGRDRACYQHPTTPSLCIKVALKAEKQSIRERNYLKFLKKKNRDLTYISQYMGTLDTNLGKGHVFELVRDEKNNIAPTLKTAIQNKHIECHEVEELVNQLKTYLYTQSICAYDLSPNNIVVVKNSNSKWSLKIIDGIGISQPNPFIIHFKTLTHKVLDKSFKRLKRKIRTSYNSSTFCQTKRNETKRNTIKPRLLLLSPFILISAWLAIEELMAEF